jgi:ABC-type transport system involved in multi-copper enzyme maturation permease subunit
MNLLKAEWTRLFARRITLTMFAIIVGLLAVIALSFGASSSTPTYEEQARANQLAAEAGATWQANRQECLDVERGAIPPAPGKTYPLNCDYGHQPNSDDYLDYGFSFKRQWPQIYYTAAIILGLFGFVIGASFIGAEWTSGGMVNLLLWRPQRAQVLAAKLGVVLAGVLAMAVVYLAVWTGAFLGVAAMAGSIGHFSAAEVGSFLLACVRVIMLGVFGAAVGFALASMGRHTAMALGAGIAYLLVYELGTLLAFAVMDVTYPERFRLSSYVIAWLTKRYNIEGSYTCNDLDCVNSGGYSIAWGESGLVLGLVAAVLIGGAFLSMRRRDLT